LPSLASETSAAGYVNYMRDNVGSGVGAFNGTVGGVVRNRRDLQPDFSAELALADQSSGLVDRISSYRAGLVLGGDGRSAVGELGFNRLDFAPRFNLVSARPLAGDTLETWARRT